MTKHTVNSVLLLVLTGISLLLFRNHSYFPWIIGAVVFAFLLLLACGILFLKFQYFLPATNRLKDKRVLLTFDDGPDPETTPVVLDILKKYNITAIFFVVGKKIEQHPEVLQRIIAEGHLVGNHTYNHSNFFSLQWQSTVERELAHCDEMICKAGGITSTYFRPPIGYTNPRIARAVKKTGKQTIGWRLRSYDSVLKEPQQLLKRLVTRVRPGDIVLLHDNLPQSATVLPAFIESARQNGIIFVDSKAIFA